MKVEASPRFRRISRMLLLVTGIVGFVIHQVNAKEYKGIVPLKTTRAEVEKKFGKPDINGNYKFDDSTVQISYVDTYYSGPCENEKNCECLVPKDTVREIKVNFPDDGVKLETFGLDLSLYKKTRSMHLLDYVTYSNSSVGVIYTVFNSDGQDRDNFVMSISYAASQKDCHDLLKSTKAH